MQTREDAIRGVGRKRNLPESSQIRHSVQFGIHAFHMRAMEQALPKKVVQNIQAVREGKERLNPTHADAIADALRDWAIQHGATHFTHWFQPLTGGAAEKHDSFFAFSSVGTPIEQFQGKHLLRGEPDASSLPSGGLRSTHNARGYTTWDPASDPFLWEAGDGMTLCIPSLYFSWKGESLDHKIPLLRSDKKISKAANRLLSLVGIHNARVFSALGPEQEYFVIDKNLYSLRPDLVLSGRTVFGAPSPKGQELQDHYFAAVKDRVLAFMREFEDYAVRIGIPVKTRHNEVAPGQYEIAPLFEWAPKAADHNLLLMQVMRHIADKHGLVCLFHEKPFASINGSGKHCNWSLITDTGLNLCDPKENHFLFLVLLTAVLRAIWEHAGLLRASIACSGNDYRLGGSEAPSPILSVFLGETLEKVIEQLLYQKEEEIPLAQQIDLGLNHVPFYEADPTDRNRSSFFAFTGNKFEFRAVGASNHPAFPISVINAIVADSLSLIVDEIADVVGDKKNLSGQQLLELCLPVLKKHLKLSEIILFGGDSYSAEWEQEAERRGLPIIRKSVQAYPQLLDKKSLRAFEEILSEKELEGRYEIFQERHAKELQIEIRLMIELFRTQILPAAQRDLSNRATCLKALDEPNAELKKQVTEFSLLIAEAIRAVDELEQLLKQITDLGWEAKAKALSEVGSVKMEKARAFVDRIETLVDNSLWPLPKYRELLFFV